MKSIGAHVVGVNACPVLLGLTLTVIPARSRQSITEIPASTIGANTRMVLVDVVVTDKKGQPVTDLKPEDFILEENGKRQKIAAFTTPQEAAKAAAPLQLGPGNYSNRPELLSPGGPITAFVLDAANTPFRDQAYGRLQMRKYVEEQSKSNRRMAVLTLTDHLQMVQDFTSDPQVLTAALERYRPQEPMLTESLSPADMDMDSRPGKDRQVRLAVRDNRTGYLGTVEGPLEPAIEVRPTYETRSLQQIPS